MAEGYTKLFSGIVMSTVWTYDSDTKVVWVTLLAMADQRGHVIGTVPGLAKMAGVSNDATRRALAIFLSPDPDSGSKEFEGRRVEVIDRGWRLLMHAKYRALRSREEKLEADRLRIAEKRATESKTPIVSGTSQKSQNVADVAHAEASASADPFGKISPPACDPSVQEQLAVAPEAIPEASSAALTEYDDPVPVYGPPIEAPRRWRPAHVGAATAHFMACFGRYPNGNGKQNAAQSWQDEAATFAGGEVALRDAILARFDAGMLKRHPYDQTRFCPNFQRFLIEHRWEDPDPKPDARGSPGSGSARPSPPLVRLTRESSR